MKKMTKFYLFSLVSILFLQSCEKPDSDLGINNSNSEINKILSKLEQKASTLEKTNNTLRITIDPHNPNNLYDYRGDTMYLRAVKIFADSSLIEQIKQIDGTFGITDSKKKIFNEISDFLISKGISFDTTISYNYVMNKDFTKDQSFSKDIDNIPMSPGLTYNVKTILKSYFETTASLRATNNPNDLQYSIQIAILYENAFYNSPLLTSSEKEILLSTIAINKFWVAFIVQNYSNDREIPCSAWALAGAIGAFFSPVGPIGVVAGGLAGWVACLVWNN